MVKFGFLDCFFWRRFGQILIEPEAKTILNVVKKTLDKILPVMVRKYNMKFCGFLKSIKINIATIFKMSRGMSEIPKNS